MKIKIAKILLVVLPIVILSGYIYSENIQKVEEVTSLIDRWVKMWNSYDINILENLFIDSEDLSYFSSEREGVIRGFKKIKEHHRNFGFSEGGKTTENRLWLEDSRLFSFGGTTVVTAVWFFKKSNLKIQKGPVSFVVVPHEKGPRIAHVHFTNYYPASGGKTEAVSFLGKELSRPVLNKKAESLLLTKLEKAESEYKKDPNDIESIIWLGRRTAYLGFYRKAIKIFSEGISRHPREARFYRHRGHRYITVREIDKAVSDLEHAARLIKGEKDRIEPDGIPNKLNIPLSTLHSNVWYHLGLAYYLKGDFENALDAYRECLNVSKNDDMKTATSHWLYMTLQLMGKEKEAAGVLVPITKNLNVIENTAYYDLLLFYKGLFSEKQLLERISTKGVDPAVMYGLGNWFYYNGKKDRAKLIFKELVKKGNWASFGHITAEAQLNRM